MLRPAASLSSGTIWCARAGREGTYWRAADGLLVRVAAPETDRAAEVEQRELLTLAGHEAVGQ